MRLVIGGGIVDLPHEILDFDMNLVPLQIFNFELLCLLVCW